MKDHKDLIKEFGWKECFVKTEEGPISALFFDWDIMQAEESELLKKADGMNEEQLSDFLSHTSMPTATFYDYYTDEDTEEKVRDGEWIPIAAMGIFGGAGSIEEMSNQGFLALNNKDKSYKKGEVLWYYEGNTHVLAKNVEELNISKS